MLVDSIFLMAALISLRKPGKHCLIVLFSINVSLFALKNIVETFPIDVSLCVPHIKIINNFYGLSTSRNTVVEKLFFQWMFRCLPT